MSIFQSTHPLRGATCGFSVVCVSASISIHAPLAGCDSSNRPRTKDNRNFNPRTPCGVRHSIGLPTSHEKPFQSTHPLRGATGRWCKSASSQGNFNPRTPCGVRLTIIFGAPGSGKFQSTHPLRGATRQKQTGKRQEAFQSTHPLRGATYAEVLKPFVPRISIHAPLAGCDGI